MTDYLSECCDAPVRWLDCEDCAEHGIVCDVAVCTDCGADA